MVAILLCKQAKKSNSSYRGFCASGTQVATKVQRLSMADTRVVRTGHREILRVAARNTRERPRLTGSEQER